MKRPDSTVLLWLANALAWFALCLGAFHQLGVLAWRPAGGALPQVKALSPRPLPTPGAAPELGARNPFDAQALRWMAAAPGPEDRKSVV